MAYNVVLSAQAANELDKLTPVVARRIIRKLDYYSQSPNPVLFAKALKQLGKGDYRFRVGDWRIIFTIKGNTISISAIGHRREVYE